MNALIDKFKKVTIKSTTLIPSDDKLVMDLLHAQYEETLEQLDEWRLFFEDQDKNFPLDGFSLSEYGGRGPKEFSVNDFKARENENPFHNLKFYVGHPYVLVQKNIIETKRRYITRVVDHFKNKYSLEFKLDGDRYLLEPELSYLKLIDGIRESLGGLNFKAIAKEQIIERLRGQIWRQDRIKLSNKIINFDSFFHADYGYIRRDNKRLSALEDGILLMETGAAAPGTYLKQYWDTTPDYGTEYALAGCEAIESFRLYGNGKLALKFKSPQLAKAFYDYFDFQSLPEKF